MPTMQTPLISGNRANGWMHHDGLRMQHITRCNGRNPHPSECAKCILRQMCWFVLMICLCDRLLWDNYWMDGEWTCVCVCVCAREGINSIHARFNIPTSYHYCKPSVLSSALQGGSPDGLWISICTGFCQHTAAPGPVTQSRCNKTHLACHVPYLSPQTIPMHPCGSPRGGGGCWQQPPLQATNPGRSLLTYRTVGLT